MKRHHIRGATVGALMLVSGLLLSQEKPWVTIGPEGGPIAAMAQCPADPSVLLCASQIYPSSIFKSTDRGSSWFRYSSYRFPSLTTVPMRLFFDPESASVVYGLNGNYFFRSSDGGETWSIHNFPSNCLADNMTLDPSDHEIIHAAGRMYDQGMTSWRMAYWKGPINGTSWTTQFLGTNEGYCYAIGVESGNPSNIYAGGYAYSGGNYYGKLFRSTNGGAEFSDVTGNIQGYVYDIADDPASPGNLYVLTYQAVYLTTDHGDTWTMNNGYLPSPQSIEVVGGVVYVGTYFGVYKGTGGLNYTLLPGSGLVTGYGALIVESSSPHHTIFFANNEGIIRSTDGGSNWTSCCSGLTIARITALRCAPSSPTTMFAALDLVAVYKASSATASTVTWARLPDFYACTNIDALVVLPTDPDVIYAMEGGG